MGSPEHTHNLDISAERARRVGIKDDITAIVGEEPISSEAIAAEIDGVSRALVRQLADELVAEGELRSLPACGNTPRRFYQPAVVSIPQRRTTPRWGAVLGGAADD